VYAQDFQRCEGIAEERTLHSAAILRGGKKHCQCSGRRNVPEDEMDRESSPAIPKIMRNHPVRQQLLWMHLQ
jgi:hypothetical protein